LLRQKYPGLSGRRQALRKLGLDERLIDQLLRKPAATVSKRTLAYDASVDRHDDKSIESERKKARLEEILANAGCSGAELDEARELLSGLHMPDIFAVEDEEFSLSENKSQKGNPDIDPVLEEIRTLLHEAKFQGGEADDAGETERRLVKLEKLLQSHGLSDGEVSDAMSRLRDSFAAADTWGLPRNNASNNGMGGRFSEAGAADRNKKRMARDARNEAGFLSRFPAAGRVIGSAVESGVSGSAEELARLRPQRIATDASAAKVKSFHERFPGSERIGSA
jgi:hypothetical protein